MIKTKLVITVAILSILLWSESPHGAADTGLTIPITVQGLTATVSIDADDREGALGIQQVGNTTIYTAVLYRVFLTSTPGATRNIVRLRIESLSEQPIELRGLSIKVRVPRSSIQGIWYPSSDLSSDNVMSTDARRAIRAVAGANYGIPYIGAASADLRNVLALGLGRQDLSVAIEGDPIDNHAYEFRLRITTPRTARVFDERFYVSADTSMNWFDTAAGYADWVDFVNGYRPFPVSEKVFEPVYDTWYWSQDNVDERLYLDTARLASEAGAGLYLADSGWDAPAGEYAKWLEGKTGNYDPPPDKFPDLQKTIETMRSDFHLGVQLWLQPFAVGRYSDRYSGTENLHIHLPANPGSMTGWQGLTAYPFALPLGRNIETVNLCPRADGTEEYLRDLFIEMGNRYNPDGYWLDFLDGIATNCIAPHAHRYSTFGEGLRHSLEAVKSAILSSNPAAVVHFRARYANLNTKRFANVWQSEDSPGDFDQMRLNALRLRPFSKGVVFASDQLYWPADAGEATVSRFIMTSVMTGVPAFGADLTKMAPEPYAMLRNWLTFYREHKHELSRGRVSLFGQLRVPNHKIEGKDHTFAYVRNHDFRELDAGGSTIFIMNASDADYFAGRVRGRSDVTMYSVKILDRFLTPEAGEMTVRTTQDGYLELNLGVLQGGVIVLTAIEPGEGEQLENSIPPAEDAHLPAPMIDLQETIVRTLSPFAFLFRP